MDGLWLSFGTGFSIGLLGSLHCIGMCGPLALALPVHRLSGWTRVGGILAYNLGRTLTYACLGALFGIIGQQFMLWGWQQALSITAGTPSPTPATSCIRDGRTASLAGPWDKPRDGSRCV